MNKICPSCHKVYKYGEYCPNDCYKIYRLEKEKMLANYKPSIVKNVFIEISNLQHHVIKIYDLNPLTFFKEMEIDTKKICGDINNKEMEYIYTEVLDRFEVVGTDINNYSNNITYFLREL